MANSRINIFADCHVFDGNFQGTTTYLKGMYLEMVKDRDKQFYLAAHDIDKLKGIFGSAANITYVRYKYNNKFLRLLIDIPGIIKKHKIDYAHFQYITPPIRHCKYITTIHDLLFLDYPEYFPWSYRIKNKFLFKLSAKRAELVLTVSGYSAKKIRKHFGIKDIIVTPNAVDPIYFEPNARKEAAEECYKKYGISNYWLYVSRWEPRKNHYRLLKVFADNGYHKNHHLVLVGDKALATKEFDAFYQNLDKEIKDKVIVLNKVAFPDLLLLVRGALLSVYPSLAEGFGIPPLEATAAGIPTACSNASAMSDFDFFGDLLFDPLSETDIHTAISKALSIQDVSAVRLAIQQRFSWKQSAKILLEAINSGNN